MSQDLKNGILLFYYRYRSSSCRPGCLVLNRIARELDVRLIRTYKSKKDGTVKMLDIECHRVRQRGTCAKFVQDVALYNAAVGYTTVRLIIIETGV